MAKKNQVSIVEMGMRDGLQNEKITLPAQTRIEFAEKLLNAGIQRLEIGAFVSPQWVPQISLS